MIVEFKIMCALKIHTLNILLTKRKQFHTFESQSKIELINRPWTTKLSYYQFSSKLLSYIKSRYPILKQSFYFVNNFWKFRCEINEHFCFENNTQFLYLRQNFNQKTNFPVDWKFLKFTSAWKNRISLHLVIMKLDSRYMGIFLD